MRCEIELVAFEGELAAEAVPPVPLRSAGVTRASEKGGWTEGDSVEVIVMIPFDGCDVMTVAAPRAGEIGDVGEGDAGRANIEGDADGFGLEVGFEGDGMNARS